MNACGVFNYNGFNLEDPERHVREITIKKEKAGIL